MKLSARFSSSVCRNHQRRGFLQDFRRLKSSRLEKLPYVSSESVGVSPYFRRTSRSEVLLKALLSFFCFIYTWVFIIGWMSSSFSSGNIDSGTPISPVYLDIQYLEDFDFSLPHPGLRRSRRFTRSVAEPSLDSSNVKIFKAVPGGVETKPRTRTSKRVAPAAKASKGAISEFGASRGVASGAGTSTGVAPRARTSRGIALGAGTSRGVTPKVETSGASPSSRGVASGVETSDASSSSATSKTSSKVP